MAVDGKGNHSENSDGKLGKCFGNWKVILAKEAELCPGVSEGILVRTWIFG